MNDDLSPLGKARRIKHLINAETATELALHYEKQVKPFEGKRFIGRRIRQNLLKRDDLHVPISHNEVREYYTIKGQKIPPLISMLIGTGQPTFKIDTNTEQYKQFILTVDNLVPWINAMHLIVGRGVKLDDQAAVENHRLTVEALKSLPYQTIDEAIATSEKWYARMNSQGR